MLLEIAEHHRARAVNGGWKALTRVWHWRWLGSSGWLWLWLGSCSGGGSGARWALALGGGCSEAEPTYGARLSGCGRLEYSTVI